MSHQSSATPASPSVEILEQHQEIFEFWRRAYHRDGDHKGQRAMEFALERIRLLQSETRLPCTWCNDDPKICSETPLDRCRDSNNAAPQAETGSKSELGVSRPDSGISDRPAVAAPSATSAERVAITSEQVAEQMHFAFRQAELLEEQGVHDVTAKVLRDAARMLGALQKEAADAEWKAAHRLEMFNQREQLIRDLQTAAMRSSSAPSSAALTSDARDAARYRWLRSEEVSTDPRYFDFWNEFNLKLCREGAMDALIDAAMKEGA